MVTPFLNARDFIFQAQNKTDLEEQKLLLQKAFDQLTTATNAVYTDLKTSADHLAKLTIRSFFRNTKQIQNYMNFLALDMQLATKFVGVYMQVLDYPLYKAWKTKSFTDGDITLHFILFDILFDPSIEMSFSEITDQIDERLSRFSELRMFAESTVRKRL